jgi:hypothetical protein
MILRLGNIEPVLRLDLSEERVQRPQLMAFSALIVLDRQGGEISNYRDYASSIASIHNEEPE